MEWIRWSFLTLLLIVGANIAGQNDQEPSILFQLEKVDVLFWDSDDLKAVEIAIRKVEESSLRKDSFAYFVSNALPQIIDWYQYGFFTESRTYLSDLFSMLNQSNDPGSLLRSSLYAQMARSYFYEGKTDSLGKYAKLSITVYNDESTCPALAHNLNGIFFEQKNDLLSAEKAYSSAIECAWSNPEGKERIDKYYSNLFRLYQIRDQPVKIIRRLTELEQLPEKQKSSIAFATIWIQVADGYNELGLYHKADECYQKASDAYQSGKEVSFEQFADLNLNRGQNTREQGELNEALVYYDYALNLYQQLAEPPQLKIGYVYRNRGNVFSQRKDYAAATEQYEKSLEVSSAMKDTTGIADDYTNLGVNFQETKMLSQALNAFSQALQFRKCINGSGVYLGNDYINLADVQLALLNTEKALLYADSARNVEEPYYTTGRHPQLAYTYLTHARIHQQQGKTLEALRWAQRSLAANHESFTFQDSYETPPIAGYSKYDYYFEALFLKGELLAGMEGPLNAQRAQSHFARAGDLLNEVKDQLTTREDQITLANYNARLAEAAIGHAYAVWARTQDARWVDEAFRYAERSKAGVLRSAIAGAAARQSAGIPDSLLRQEEELTATIGYHKRELASGPDSTARVRHQRELFTASQAQKDILATFERDYPRYAELKRAVPTLTLSELQAVLQPNEVVRSYFTGTDKLYVFSIDRKRTTLHEQDKPKRLDRDVSGLVKGMTRRIDRLYLRKAHELYQLLVPESETAKGQKTILIPDGPLLKIPFEALLAEPVATTDNTDFSTLPYFLKEHTISYAASASLFYEARLGEQDRGNDRSATDKGLLAFAPVFENGKVSASAQRSMKENALLSALPATRTELNALQSLFTANGRSVTTLIGPAATEASLRRNDLTNARYLHFATHGFVNEQFPDLSGLALYPDASGGTDDNFLSVGEVYNLKLNAELVTLSACETGLGKVANGEGVLGFTHAFLYAGAQNLLVSLWQVQDKATSDLMVDFYRRTLTEGDKGLSGNLRAAKLQMIRAGGFSHPYYWSPFVLIGE